MRARIVAPDELTAKDLAGWSQCAASSLEPNPFLEPDWLLPALAHLDESPNARLVLAEQGDAVLACVPIAEVTADQTGTACQGRRSALETRVAPTAVALGTPLVAEEGGCEALACLMSEIGREAQRRGVGPGRHGVDGLRRPDHTATEAAGGRDEPHLHRVRRLGTSIALSTGQG